MTSGYSYVFLFFSSYFFFHNAHIACARAHAVARILCIRASRSRGPPQQDNSTRQTA